MTEQRHVLVCYDIANPKRLRLVHRAVRDFGRPLQYSVFACRLGAADRARLEARLLKIIKSHADQVVLVDLGPAHHNDSTVPGTQVLGLAEAKSREGPVVV